MKRGEQQWLGRARAAFTETETCPVTLTTAYSPCFVLVIAHLRASRKRQKATRQALLETVTV